MSCECLRCRAFSRVLTWRSDPAAPLPFEHWLHSHPEEWPWWLLGGIVGMIGLLLLSAVGALLILAGVCVAAVPAARQLLDACDRVPG